MSSSGRKVAQIWPVFATVRLAWSNQSYKKTIFLACTSIFWNCSYSLRYTGMHSGVWFMVGRAVHDWLSLYVWKLDAYLILKWFVLMNWKERNAFVETWAYVYKVGHMSVLLQHRVRNLSTKYRHVYQSCCVVNQSHSYFFINSYRECHFLSIFINNSKPRFIWFIKA